MTASRLAPPLRVAAIYLFLFLIAFPTHGYLWRDAPIQEGDSPQYLEVAQDLSDFRLDTLHDRTPGYPLLLALTGSTQQPTRALFFVSLALHFASVWLLALVLHDAGVRTSWLLAFGVLLILPPYAELAGYVMTENLAQFALVMGLACLILGFPKRNPALLTVSAIAFGCSALVRPVNQALALTIGICLLLFAFFSRQGQGVRSQAFRASAVLVAGSLLILGAVSWVNYNRFGYFGVIPSIGFHLSTKTMPFVERLPEEYAPVREILIRERDALLIKRGGSHTGTQAIWGVRSDLARMTGLSMPQLSSYLLKMNLRLIRTAPVEYLQEVARSMSVYWFPAAGPLANMNSSVLRWLWALIHVALVAFLFLQLAVVTGVAAGSVAARVGQAARRSTPLFSATRVQALSFMVAAVIVFYTMILSCALDIGEPRQRRSTDVLVVFLCFLGAHVWKGDRHLFEPIDTTSR